MQAVVLSDGNSPTVGAGEAFDLHAIDGAKNILIPVFRIQERNLAIITLEIQIVQH